jgi:hypothetical protein
MNSKSTGTWFLIAAALFAFIFFWHRHVNQPVADTHILPGLRPPTVTSVQITAPGALEIRADYTNGQWLLTQPAAYPAQRAAIETLLDALQKLTFAMRFSAGELRAHPNADTEYGFDNPQFKLVIEAGDQRWQLRVGNRTAPGDQVFLRVVGMDGAYVADAGWLNAIPRTADNWRDTALVDAGTAFDGIVLTNNASGIVIELHRDATNHLWHMLYPLHARADSERITEALQKLYPARLTQFVTDNPQTDPTAFGLQPANVDVWFYRGSNSAAVFHIGKSPTNDPASVFVRRDGWNVIATTAKQPLLPWRGTVNDFRDPYLLELTAPVAEIEVCGTNRQNNFTLQRHGSNDWTIAGEKFPADAENAQLFIKLLAGLRVAEFVQDVVTPSDWQAYGLAAPKRQITLRSAAGDTNAVIAQLLFGSTQTNEVFVRRADEPFIYGIPLADTARLPEYGWEFRDRSIWHFSETNVVSLTLRQNGKTRQLHRNGVNQWSLAPGSQGVINPPALEETTHGLGQLTVLGWVSPNVTQPEQFGLDTNNLQITVELKTGEKYSMDFGAELPQDQTALAAATLDGERWAFVFPPPLYQLVKFCLTIPADVP